MIKNFIYFLISIFIASCINNKKSNIDINRLSKIDNMINKEIENNNIPGAVLLVGDEKKVIYQKAYGIKNPITKEKYKIDDIFRIASMTKAITSIAVIKLWEEGKIGLDDPIEKYIPEFKDIKILKSFNEKDS
ncbi:MAG: serine hydrolase, partial [Candidatus Marinimicrobia bacterium]|nr:serine hydrolase [Candidatus Neomarinimicrobiota bacterium]